MKIQMTKLEKARWTYINTPDASESDSDCHVLMRRPCLAVTIDTTKQNEFQGATWAHQTIDHVYVSLIGTDKRVLVRFCSKVRNMIEDKINEGENLSLETVPLPDGIKELLVSPPSSWKYYIKHPNPPAKAADPV